MYPGFPFAQQPFAQNPIMGQLPMQGGPQLPQFGQQAPQQPDQHHGGMFGGMSPLFGLAGMLAHSGKFGQFAPMLGGLLGFGLSKSGLFK